MALRPLLIGFVVIPILFSGCQRMTAGRRSSIVPSRATAIAGEDARAMNCPVTKTILDQPPKDPNADPLGFGEWYVNADRTIWVQPQSWRVGDEGNKVIWIKPAGFNLNVSGRRLDAPAPPLRVSSPCCYPTGFQVTGVIFPTAGCWEITATAGSSELRFVTEVAKNKSFSARLRKLE